jgi:hypothetical protein
MRILYGFCHCTNKGNMRRAVCNQSGDNFTAREGHKSISGNTGSVGAEGKPRQNIVYLSAELNRLCRMRVSTDKSIRDLSPVGGLILPLYSVVAHRNATSRVQSI